MELKSILNVVDDVPDYGAFLTVDELNASTQKLAERYPGVVELLPLGQSRAGDPIEAVKIGTGSRAALIFAMPHPNEPIGSMMLEYLTERLASDESLRDALDFTWYCVKCVDPDGARLNEGWFKGPFTITNYARNYYRPPSHLQVEWTFPAQYKELDFSSPLPETQALMKLIEEIHPDFIYSLHNAGFGGAYFYISEDARELRRPFYDLVQRQGLHLHLGEPEAPWMTKFADAIFEAPSIEQMYDFMESQGVDVGKAITGGTCSWDYAGRYGNPFSLLCEMPYFHNDAVHDTSDSDEIRRQVIMDGYEKIEEQFATIVDVFQSVSSDLTAASPFKDAIESFIGVVPNNVTAMKNWAQSAPETEATATRAERFDNLYVKRFYFVFLNMGMAIRMLKYQIEASGRTAGLADALETAEKAFDELSAELEKEMSYSVIPIRNLVQVQLGAALLAASYSESR